MKTDSSNRSASRSRREFLGTLGASSIALSLTREGYASAASMADQQVSPFSSSKGDQRLSLTQLQAWESLGFGMFIHFGMSTYDMDEYSKGNKPSTLYAPDRLDVDQWISVARDAGMKYAILTTKHVAGHCLWPSRLTDYQVGTSSNKTDVVEDFVKACEKRQVMPGFYYCAWDNHNLFGSKTPSMTAWTDAYTTEQYQEFQWKQLDELLTQYGKIGEIWLDIPGVLPRGFRHRLYGHLVELQPQSIILTNHGIGDGSQLNIAYAWPTDVITIERFLPNSQTKHVKWRKVEGQDYYLPGEVCDPIGKAWFYADGDEPRGDAELLGMFLICRSRGANLLLDVPPDRHGLIPKSSVEALRRMENNIRGCGFNL